jgi:membrane protein involved in colicin uptake
MGRKKLTPEEMGRSLEEFVFWHSLEKEAQLLGTKTKAEVEAGSTLTPEERARAEEIGRKANEAYAKAKAEKDARAKAEESRVAKPASNVVSLDERRRRSQRRSSKR